MALKVGDEAPDFELRSHRGGTVKLSSFRGKKNVVLAFHPLAFTPVCANQMSGYQTDSGRFEAADAVVLGVSIDAQPAKAAWAETLGSLSYDLLSDFHPHGRVADQYGVFRPKEGFSERAVFVIDREGRIRWSKVYDIPQLPDGDELFAALDNLK
jgi:peroxiredoxin